MESVKVNKTTKDALSELERTEGRPEDAIVADMLQAYQVMKFKARVKEAQARPLPTAEDPEMAEWESVNRRVHEGRATKRHA